MAARLLLAVALALAAAAAGCGGGGRGPVPPGAALVPAGAAAFVSADGRAAPLLSALSWPKPPVALYLRRLGGPPVEAAAASPPVRSLAEDEGFRRAMGRLPEDAALRAYVAGPAVLDALDRALARAGLPGGLARSFLPLRWISLAADPAEGGFRLRGAVAAGLPQEPPAFSPTLPGEVPAGAEAAVFLSRLDIPLGGLVADLDRISPRLARQIDLAQGALGLSLEGDVLPALAGEAALARYPAGTLLAVRLDGEDEAALRTLLSRLGPVLALAGLGSLRPQAGGAYRLALAGRDVELLVVVEPRRLLVTDAPRLLRRLRAGGGALAAGARYRRLLERADLPQEVVALAYGSRPGASALIAATGRGGLYDLRGFLALD